PLQLPIPLSAAPADRKQPLVLWRGAVSFELEADLAPGHEALHLPDDIAVEHACFSMTRKSEAKGRHGTVRTSYKNTCKELAPADYPAFRAAVQKAMAHAQDNLLFG